MRRLPLPLSSTLGLRMFDRVISKKIAAISCVVLCVSACNPNPENPNEFKGVVSNWHLEQLSSQAAIELLTKKGFSAKQYKAESYFKDQRDYVYATQSKLTFLICGTEWRVILMLEKNSVAEVKPLVFFNCI